MVKGNLDGSLADSADLVAPPARLNTLLCSPVCRTGSGFSATVESLQTLPDSERYLSLSSLTSSLLDHYYSRASSPNHTTRAKSHSSLARASSPRLTLYHRRTGIQTCPRSTRDVLLQSDPGPLRIRKHCRCPFRCLTHSLVVRRKRSHARRSFFLQRRRISCGCSLLRSPIAWNGHWPIMPALAN